MNVAAQEMTLDEWVDRLPTDHRARRELAELRAQVDKLTTENKTLTTERDEARKERDAWKQEAEAWRELDCIRNQCVVCGASLLDDENIPQCPTCDPDEEHEAEYRGTARTGWLLVQQALTRHTPTETST